MSEELFIDNLPIEEIIAIWMDGGLTYEQELDLMTSICATPELAEVLDSIDNIESDYEDLSESEWELPSELMFDFNLPEISHSVVFEDDILNTTDYPETHENTYEPEENIESQSQMETQMETSEYTANEENEETEEPPMNEWYDLL